MRISEDRYTRDLRRLHLARRLIRHEVRTQWICDCTELSDKRIRNLFHSYDAATGCVIRRRGRSPTALAPFLRAPLRAEASASGGLARAFGLIPAEPSSHSAAQSPDLETGERYVDAFDLFRKVAPQSTLKMDQFITLVQALAEGEELQLGHCLNCHGTLVIDPLGLTRRICPACEGDSGTPRSGACRHRRKRTGTASRERESEKGEVGVPYQRSLFGEDDWACAEDNTRVIDNKRRKHS
jgi:hypothetical protein